MNLKPLFPPLGYRPELDGLRAVAVLAVILFHLDASLLPCGFLGVDIFFVISGYLITSIILSEWSAGRFSVAEFYRRRIQRILPLFFVVIASGLALSYALMMPEDRLSVEKSAVASCVFLANILLPVREATSMFRPRRNPSSIFGRSRSRSSFIYFSPRFCSYCCVSGGGVGVWCAAC